MSRDNLNDLAAFVAVAEARSFTRAAKRLGVSQSALSHAMRGLEERLGIRLLSRTTRSVATTDAGERLLAAVAPRLADISNELDALSALRVKPAGKIRITTSEHAAHRYLWPVVEGLIRDNPEVSVEVTIDGTLIDIVAERYDAGIRLGESVEKDMITVRIGPDMRMAAVAAPEYLAEHGVPKIPQDLSQHKCINLRFQPQGSIYAWEFSQGAREINVRVEGPLTLNNTGLIVRAATSGLGIAYLLEDHVGAHIQSGALVRVLDDWCEPFGGYHLYYPSRRQHSAAFALLVEHLRYRSGVVRTD